MPHEVGQVDLEEVGVGGAPGVGLQSAHALGDPPSQAWVGAIGFLEHGPGFSGHGLLTFPVVGSVAGAVPADGAVTGAHGHREAVVGGRDGATVEVGEAARRDEGPVEVHRELLALGRAGQAQEAARRVGLGARGAVGEDEDEVASVEEGLQLVALVLDGDDQAAGDLLGVPGVGCAGELPRDGVGRVELDNVPGTTQAGS